MTSQQTALEHLRVIRSLMEKAHIYRAVSAPAALVGGILALGVSVMGVASLLGFGDGPTREQFLGQWLAVLAVTSILNIVLLARQAAQRGESLISEGMRMALRALLPPMLVGGIVGIGLILYLHNLTMAVLIWVLTYGLALLATASFSPRSLIRLGWIFVIAGLALFWIWAANSEIRLLASDEAPASIVMGLTFGLLHIGYAAAVFLNKPMPSAEEAAAE